ncbi:MAG: hypothetical protein U9N40_06705 [Euryarchaeota archaeon]|nr:hypothetical protein [Euryarchaeota archaeon]
MSGNNIVYTAAFGEAINLSTPRGVFLYSTDTHDTKLIGTTPANMTLTGADISGDYIVWFEEPQVTFNHSKEETGRNRIILYSVAEDSSSTIYSSEDASWPKVSGQQVIWSDTSGDSFTEYVTLYNISSEKTKVLPGISSVDGADIGFDGGQILYQNSSTLDLCLYNIPSEKNTIVSKHIHTNTSVVSADKHALGGNYIIFTNRIMNKTGPEKGISNELILYIISTGETKYINPSTGEFVDKLSKQEKSAIIDYPFADQNRVGWVDITGISKSVIKILNPVTSEVSSIHTDYFVSFPHLDGDSAVWGDSGKMILGTEKTDKTPPVPATSEKAVPGFGFIAGLSALAVVGVAVVLRRNNQ